jgi:hypothetical protein
MRFAMKYANTLICILSVTACLLLGACLLPVFTAPAKGEVTINERKYRICTASLTSGGDALVIVRNNDQKVAILVFDPMKRQLALRGVLPLSDFFKKR